MSFAATVLMRDPTGARVGALRVSALPGRAGPEDRSDDAARPRSEPATQLREATVYRYELELSTSDVTRLEPSELFDPDDVSAVTGRLHTRQYVGDVVISAIGSDGGIVGSGVLLVRAAKLEHEREYQQMLRDIADLAAEAVFQGFAPATTTTSISPGRASRLLYQQFAILEARLADDELQNALAEVIHRPHRDWVREVEWRPPGRPLKMDAEAAKALVAPGRRVRTTTRVGTLDTLPTAIASYRTDETIDTIPNRFVKFALTHWRELAARLGALLVDRTESAYGIRGITAVERVIEALDDVLSERFFDQVGPLREVPTSNQVLLKREGYRQVFATFALIESSLDLRLDLDEAIRPSQRNIASLYEYWTFIRLVEALGEQCGDSQAGLRLFEDGGDGLSLGLKRGRESKLEWNTAIAGRQLAVSVYFNRTFRATDELDREGSWTRAMVPDASVLVRPIEGRARVESERDLDVWLHFDAKYKLEWSPGQFERVRPELEEREAVREEEQERLGSSRREDLLKMHAYRDAIRRSAGAYVLFPGTATPLRFTEYVELIPGLGAFPLRPGSDIGPAALSRFLADVLLHVADQATADERARVWRSRIFHQRTSSALNRAADFLDAPPADTQVLIAFVPTPSQWEWTHRTGEWAVPLGRDGRGLTVHAEALSAPLVILAGGGAIEILMRVGTWSFVQADDLRVLDHPDSSDAPRLLCRVQLIDPQPTWLHELGIAELIARASTPDSPLVVRWADLVQRTRSADRLPSQPGALPRPTPRASALDRAARAQPSGSQRRGS